VSFVVCALDKLLYSSVFGFISLWTEFDRPNFSWPFDMDKALQHRKRNIACLRALVLEFISFQSFKLHFVITISRPMMFVNLHIGDTGSNSEMNY